MAVVVAAAGMVAADTDQVAEAEEGGSLGYNSAFRLNMTVEEELGSSHYPDSQVERSRAAVEAGTTAVEAEAGVTKVLTALEG